jgi:hypothetical protein
VHCTCIVLLYIPLLLGCSCRPLMGDRGIPNFRSHIPRALLVPHHHWAKPERRRWLQIHSSRVRRVRRDSSRPSSPAGVVPARCDASGRRRWRAWPCGWRLDRRGGGGSGVFEIRGWSVGPVWCGRFRTSSATMSSNKMFVRGAQLVFLGGFRQADVVAWETS